MYTSEELIKKVNDYIESTSVNRQPEGLYEPIRYVLSLGGKRIRPVLMLLAYNMFKDNPETIMETAVGLETYHNFTLLHDDLMDNADVRRGMPTVHKKWNANTAILSGDTMLIIAFQRVARCKEEKRRPVLVLCTKTVLEIDEGQQYDIDFETRNDVTEEEYIEMIRLKTSVLLACAVKMGAIMAGASEEDASHLYNFGEKLGLAFQLQDDLLDVYGDPKVFGKAIGGDITSNKKTYMLINAMLRADGKQKAELTRWINAEKFDKAEKIKAVTEIYNSIGIRELCEKKINDYFEQARLSLQKVNLPDEKTTQLQHFTDLMMKREK